MTSQPIKEFLHIKEIQQKESGTNVTFFWEIKLAYLEKGYYGFAVETASANEIKWLKLDAFGEDGALKEMISKCKELSR